MDTFLLETKKGFGGGGLSSYIKQNPDGSWGEYTDFEMFLIDYPAVIPFLIIAAIAVVIALGVLAFRIATQIQTKKALWTLEKSKPCKVTLVYCYDDKISQVEHKKGDIFIPEFPMRSGFLFDGWYLETARITPYKNKVLNQDITLYAKWVKEAE